MRLTMITAAVVLLASACSAPSPPHLAEHLACVKISGSEDALQYAIANIEVMKDWDVAKPEGTSDCTPNVTVQVGTSEIGNRFSTAGYVGGAVLYEPANDLFYHGGISTADSFRKSINWALNETTDAYGAKHAGKTPAGGDGLNRIATNGASCILVFASEDADQFIPGSITRNPGWTITEPGAKAPCVPRRALSILTMTVEYNYNVIGFGVSAAVLQLRPPFGTDLSVGFNTSRPRMINDVVESALKLDLS